MRIGDVASVLGVQIPPPALLLIFCLFLANFLILRKERAGYIHFGWGSNLQVHNAVRILQGSKPIETQTSSGLNPICFIIFQLNLR